MTNAVLVTGATGTVGSNVVRGLRALGTPVVAAVRSDPDASLIATGAVPVRFDFEDPSTFAAALDGVDRVFLVRPPHMSDASAFEPFLGAVASVGVSQVVFMSLLGVERNPIVPHHAIEKAVKASGVPWTMLRPSFFMQNLSTTHLPGIIERGEIIVPAGNGRTSLIDARDIADAAVAVLTEPGHLGLAYTLTGAEALTYGECAEVMSRLLGREIRYTAPSPQAFARFMAGCGHPPAFVAVMQSIYLVAKLRMAATITGDLEHLTGRPPRTFEEFVRDHASVFGSAD